MESTELAEQSGQLGLRSFAFGARSHAAFEHLRFDEAAAWSERRLELVHQLDDPDRQCEVYESAVPVASGIGRFDDARRFAELHWGIARRLSAHHRVHSISLVAEIADTTGSWDLLVAETGRIVEAVTANLTTPCVRNSRDFFLCALAHLASGDDSRADELEREARAISGEGHERELTPPQLRLALLRGDAERVRELVEPEVQRPFVWGTTVYATRLDALVALRAADTIEREAPLLAVAGSALEPFALRALGVARGDDDLLARADELFAALGLEWHRAQTERLVTGV